MKLFNFLTEGKSPHKKGTAKYKKHMAAMHAEEVEVDEVAGAKDCWDGYKKDGTQAGTGKNKGKRVNKCVKEDEVDGADYSQDGMIGTPDGYYDAEERQEAYRDLKDALGGAKDWQEDSIKDGICPECAGSGYMDGEYEDEDGNEGDDCYGWGDFGCDEGEMTQRDDGLPNWAEIAKHDEKQVSKANRGPAPSKEQIMKILPRLHDEYVKSGRYNAFELGSILKQLYPELNKREAGSYVADFLSNFKEQADLRRLAGLEEGPNYDASDIHRGDAITCKRCKGKGCDHCDDKGVHAKSDVKETEEEFKPHMMYDPKTGEGKMAKVEKDHLDMKAKGWSHDEPDTKKIEEGDSDDVVVAKMLSKALGDPNRWMEMSPPELYAELESTNPEVADMISKVAKMLYDVRLQERTYKDVGVADVQKDPRGKEFKFDKDAKQFKSQDGELADIKTKTGQDLMKKRKLSMKKSTPSYNKKSTPKKKGLIAKLFQDLEG